MNHHERVDLIDRANPRISTARQADLLGISRSSIYYCPKGDEEDVPIMRRIDEIYTHCPFYGSRRIKHELESYDIFICREHVQRLMHLMGIEAVYPKKRRNTSQSDNAHHKYPYLLSGVRAAYPNHIWGTDITYVRLEEGWAYLVAILDWFSRYVLSWELSRTLESDFCVAALNRALAISTPNIHNSDQGRQFTAQDYVSILEGRNIRISMDGRGRCMDNIFTERLWRTVKYEDIYLKSYADVAAAREGLNEYFEFYNTRRKHQSLQYRTPADVFFNVNQSSVQKVRFIIT